MKFIDSLERMTESWKVPPDKVHLEISNDMITGASNTALETLRRLNAFGFKLALNNFRGDDINLNHI